MPWDLLEPKSVRGFRKTGDIVPRTRGWQAAIAAAGMAEFPFLRVRGEIELGNTNEHPHLAPTDLQTPDPAVLDFDVRIAIEGPSELVMHWAAMEIRHPIPEPPPETVRIIWMGVEVAVLTIPS